MTEKANLLTTDKDGFLLDRQTWNEAVAIALAQQEGLPLTADHLSVLYVLRDFYDAFQLHPALRILIKKLAEQWPPEKANSLYLHQLFPAGVIKQASKIAGLPKPLKCI